MFYESTAWFVSVLVGNTEDRYSHNEAHLTAYSMWHFKLMDRKEKLLFVLFGFLLNILSRQPRSSGGTFLIKVSISVVITLPISPYRNISCVKAKKKKCLISRNPTYPTFLRPTLNFFFETF